MVFEWFHNNKLNSKHEYHKNIKTIVNKIFWRAEGPTYKKSRIIDDFLSFLLGKRTNLQLLALKIDILR